MEHKRNIYLSWDEYFMSLAYLISQRSKDPNTQVGAVIVNSDNRVVGTGYNGFPNGCSDDVLPWGKNDSENILNTKYPYVVHAEANAIINSIGISLKDCTIFSILAPCNECTKLIIQSGIKKVIYSEDKYHDEWQWVAARKMMDLAKIDYNKFNLK